MLEDVSLGDWGQIAIATVALLAAIFYGKRQIDKRRFVYQIKSTPIIKIDGVSHEDIEIRFKGIPVQQLTLYSVSVFNLGNRPILREDWDETLRIRFGSSIKIVDARLAASFPKNLKPPFVIKAENNDKEIHFEPFLINAREGFRAEIIIAGEQDPILHTRIVGISQIEQLDIQDQRSRLDHLSQSAFLLLFVIISSCALMLWASFQLTEASSTIIISLASKILILVVTLLVVSEIFKMLRIFTHANLGKNLIDHGD